MSSDIPSVNGEELAVPGRTRIEVREKEAGDQNWVNDLLAASWASTRIVSRGRLCDASQLAAFVALFKKRRSGLLTYRISQKECEIVTLNSLVQNVGIGTALLDAVTSQAELGRCVRLWLITTNDNTNALHFYQRRGFRIAAIHVRAIEESRKLKPELPLLGYDGIPILDEIELERTIVV